MDLTTLDRVTNLGSAFTGDALRIIQAVKSPSGVPAFQPYTQAQIQAQNQAAQNLGPGAPSSTSGVYKYLLIGGVALLGVVLVLELRKGK